MKYCFFIFLLLSCFSPFAQTENIARLRQKISQATNEKSKLTSYILLLEEHESIFKDSLQPIASRCLSLARSLQDKTAEGYAWLGIINAQLRNDNPNTADSIIHNTLKNYTLSISREADIVLRLNLAAAGILAANADYEGTVASLLSIAQDAENVGNYSVLSRCFNELGVISYNLNELPQALQYFQRALSYNDRNPNAKQALAYARINMAMVYSWQEQFDTAQHYLSAAIATCKQIENLYYLANAYSVQANIYKWSGRMPLAEAALLRMVSLREKTEGNLSFSNEQLSLGNYYVHSKNYHKAISIYQEGLAYHAAKRASGMAPNFELLLHYYEGLAKSYSATGPRNDYENALKQIISIKDSVADKSSALAIADMQTKYEVQKKETTIMMQELALSRKNILFYGSLLVSFFGLIIGWLLFKAYQRKSRMRIEAEIRHTASAVKEAEEGERRRIAADLHDNLGSYAAGIKSSADELKSTLFLQPQPALDLLQENAQQMVALLSDTIWAMRHTEMNLSGICDRVKLLFQRMRPNFKTIEMRVSETLVNDATFSPTQSYHLLMIVQEAINNALRHSHCQHLLISVSCDNIWSISIKDDGIGITKTDKQLERGNGIQNMQQRAQNIPCMLEWKSLESGTVVIIQQA
ncbi:MAG: tetratricopeptide repeat protein [Bacteroidetes bacterium]|nr:tetratricopeptide repeat protein [Bacteroidota bacterium]